MPAYSADIFYYDVAAVIVMAIALLSFVMRSKTKTPANRVYFSALLLVTIMSLLSLSGELIDAFLGAEFLRAAMGRAPIVYAGRCAITLCYYLLRVLTAPAYMVLIATVSSTSHRLNNTTLKRIFLWGPMIAVSLVVLTNPLHHQVFSIETGVQQRGPLVILVYASALYYSLIGIGWLFRWRATLSNNEFATLMMLYPMVFIAVIIQYYMPHVRIEMFITSVSMMLVAAFVLQPEKQLDSLVNAASLQAYYDVCSRAIIAKRPLCLVYLEIVNLEQLRELLGKDEINGLLQGVTNNIAQGLQKGDILYYLRNGLFCITPANSNAARAAEIAQSQHEEGRARAMAQGDPATNVRMRSCVVRLPEDINDMKSLHTFVRRFAHLVPDPRGTTFTELKKRDDFALQMALPSLVQKGIINRSFEIYYQPVFCLRDNRFHSAEALVRLHDEEFGWVSPALFIPEAEQSGAILEIGKILLQKICAFLGTIDYDALGLSYVELNLSVEQCVRPQLAGEVLGLVEKNHIEPSRINIEITETATNSAQDAIEANVRRLAAAGVTFSVDDYGTGYSNLTRLLRLPFTLVKFDKSFVDNLSEPSTRTVFARSVAMMKEIGKDVLVEGVETKEQVDALRAMGVDYIQGYVYAKPIPQEELVAFLRAHHTA